MARSNKKNAQRERPAMFRALGDAKPPATVTVGGVDYVFEEQFKHDSWAATALYRDAGGRRITCKFGRQQPIFIIPMRWLGRGLSVREAYFLDRFGDLDLVPDNLGPVSAGGKVLDYAVARHFIEGEPFRDASQIDDTFFPTLRDLLTTVHQRDIAYVDLHKRENIIVDRQGRPNLIDFQVSFGLRENSGARPIARAILKRLQEMDWYHVNKHYVRCCRGSLSADEIARLEKRPWLIRAHRAVAVPFRTLRRRLLVALGIRDSSGHAHSELEPEVAFRKPGSAVARPDGSRPDAG